MNDTEKKTLVLKLQLSKIMYAKLGRYRSSLNFITPYQQQMGAGNQQRTVRIAVIILYALIAVVMAVIMGRYYILTETLRKETAIIEPRINTEEETRLNTELSAAQALLTEYETINEFFIIDETQYVKTHGLQEEDFNTFFTAANPGVRLTTILYNNTEGVVSLECESDGPNMPSQFVKKLKNSFPGADIEYTGYIVVDDMIRFSVRCTFKLGDTE